MDQGYHSNTTVDTTHNDTLSRKGKDPVRRHQITKALQQKYEHNYKTPEERSRMFKNIANNRFPTTTEEYIIGANIKEGEEVSLNLKYGNDKNNVQSVYVKYKDVAKRKFYWYIWEAGRDNYKSYEEFKRNFDPNKNVFKEIAKAIKTDVSKEISDLLNTNPLRTDRHKAVYNRDFPKIYNPNELNRLNDLHARLNKATTIPREVIENNKATNSKLSPRDRVRSTRK